MLLREHGPSKKREWVCLCWWMGSEDHTQIVFKRSQYLYHTDKLIDTIICVCSLLWKKGLWPCGHNRLHCLHSAVWHVVQWPLVHCASEWQRARGREEGECHLQRGEQTQTALTLTPSERDRGGKKRTNRDLNPESDATTHEHFYSIWTGAKEVLYKYVGVCPCVDISCRVRLCTYVLSLRARCERVRMCECLNGFSRGLQYQCHMWEVLSLLYWPWHAGSLAMQHGSQQHLLHHKHTCSAVKLWKQPA